MVCIAVRTVIFPGSHSVRYLKVESGCACMCVYVRGMTRKCVYVFVCGLAGGVVSCCCCWQGYSASATCKPTRMCITAADRLAVCVGEGDSLWHAAVQEVCLQQAACSGAWSQQTTRRVLLPCQSLLQGLKPQRKTQRVCRSICYALAMCCKPCHLPRACLCH